MQPCVVSVDIGTSSLKAACIDAKGFVHKTAHVTFSGNPSTGKAFFAQEWESALGTAMGVLQGTSSVSIVGVVISGHGPTLVPLDKDNKPLSEVLFWLDGRQKPIENSSSFFLPKARWFALEKPTLYQELTSFMSCPEYLSFCLTGESWTVVPHEPFVPYFWTSPDILNHGLKVREFPPFLYTANPMGLVSQTASERFFLPPGIPVFGGGSDFLMSLLGSATVEPGMVCDRAGSSEGINYCNASPIHARGLRTLPHVIEGLWNVGGILPASGLLFEWFRRVTGQHNRSYGDMLQDIVSLDPQDDPPFFVMDPQGLGTFKDGMFAGLEPWHGPAHLSHAVVESIGFSVLDAIKRLEDEGLGVRSLRMCGGQARNEAWCQFKANILGRPIEIPQVADAELMGNAIAGFTGLGEYTSLVEGARSMVGIARTYEPIHAAHEQSMERYQRYYSLRPRFFSTAVGTRD